MRHGAKVSSSSACYRRHAKELYGFAYLVTVIDWYSRKVLAFRLSNTLDGVFCQECLDSALAGGQSEIFNTDQGSQSTSVAFTGRLEATGIRISMDGRGAGLGQRVCRAAVAVGEVRRYLPQRLHDPAGRSTRADSLR